MLNRSAIWAWQCLSLSTILVRRVSPTIFIWRRENSPGQVEIRTRAFFFFFKMDPRLAFPRCAGKAIPGVQEKIFQSVGGILTFSGLSLRIDPSRPGEEAFQRFSAVADSKRHIAQLLDNLPERILVSATAKVCPQLPKFEYCS